MKKKSKLLKRGIIRFSNSRIVHFYTIPRIKKVYWKGQYSGTQIIGRTRIKAEQYGKRYFRK